HESGEKDRGPHFSDAKILKITIGHAVNDYKAAKAAVRKAGTREARAAQGFAYEKNRNEARRQLLLLQQQIRHHHLALGCLRDIAYQDMEEVCRINPRWDLFEQIVKRFWSGPDQDREQNLARWYDGALTERSFNGKNAKNPGQRISVSFRPAVP